MTVEDALKIANDFINKDSNILEMNEFKAIITILIEIYKNTTKPILEIKGIERIKKNEKENHNYL